jgi:hypothetical protein
MTFQTKRTFIPKMTLLQTPVLTKKIILKKVASIPILKSHYYVSTSKFCSFLRRIFEYHPKSFFGDFVPVFSSHRQYILLGLNKGSLCGLENLFQGQTS